MSDTLPRPNLPEHAEQWARTAATRMSGVQKALIGVSQTLQGYNRSNAAITADLARRTQKLTGATETLADVVEGLEDATEDMEDAALQLQDALEAVPVAKQARGHGDDFEVTGTWETRATASIVVPEGKTRANVIASGQARVADAGVTTGGGGGVGPVPDSYVVTNSEGVSVTLEKYQLEWASLIIGVGKSIPGVGEHGTIIALMTAMVESVFRFYANSNVPESLSYPHDAVGSDNDSLGLFQQRPVSGWGTVAELMNGNYNARAFFGGPSGPNAGNPPGLLDISGWENMSYGQAAQTVQVSAFPARYETWKAAMIDLYGALTTSGGGSGTFIWPFPLDFVTSEYGPRTYPYEGFHEGIDFAGGPAAAGSPIVASADGFVQVSEYGSGWGNHVRLTHSVPSAPGGAVSTLYAHMVSAPLVSTGTSVTQGQVLGYVGNTGNSFGAHLHFETWEGVVFGTHINPRTFMERYANASGGGGGGSPVPGGSTTSYSRVRSRIVIGNAGSMMFQPSWDDIGEYGKNVFFPRWGRTIDVAPGDTLECMIQFRADRPVKSHNDTYADIIAFGVFS